MTNGSVYCSTLPFKYGCPTSHGKGIVIACANPTCEQAIGYAEWDRRKATSHNQKGTTRMASRKQAQQAPVEPATQKDVRIWAAENGVEVGARGRIRTEVLEAFVASTKRPLA
jgi:hypothetical protein